MRRMKNAKQLEDNVFQKQLGIICFVDGAINLPQKHCRQHSIFVYTGYSTKSGPYFNMSNLFTEIDNMLYYITNLYLQKGLEMMSIHFKALTDTFHYVPRNFS